MQGMRSPLQGINSPFGSSSGAITLTMTGLTSGEARPGDHASISVGFPTGVTAWSAQAWGVGTYGDDTYGTGGSPTDYTASDGLNLLWEGTGDDGKTYRASAPIRYAVGSFAALTNQSFTDDTGNQTYVFDAATGTGLTWTYALVSPPSGVTIVSATRTITFDTNALALQTGTSISVSATDQYGRAATGSPRSFDLDIVDVPLLPTDATVLAAWDFTGDVFQDAARTTAATIGDPLGGAASLTSNDIPVEMAGSVRPTLVNDGGVQLASLDGTDDAIQSPDLYTNYTSDMTFIISVKDYGGQSTNLLGSTNVTSGAAAGFAIDAGATSPSVNAGTPTYHVNDGASLTTRDALYDAMVAASASGSFLIEMRGVNATAASWVSPAAFFAHHSSFRCTIKIARIVVLTTGASAGVLSDCRDWAGYPIGVTL